jgi:hypothetical protein
MAHRWNKLTGKQMTVVALLLEPSRREPAPEAERILIVYFAATQARAKGAAPSANCEGGGQTGDAVTKTLSALPPSITDGVDNM